MKFTSKSCQSGHKDNVCTSVLCGSVRTRRRLSRDDSSTLQSDSSSCPILFWKRKSTTRTAATTSRPLETDTFRALHSKLIGRPTTGDPTTPTTRWINWEKRAESTGNFALRLWRRPANCPSPASQFENFTAGQKTAFHSSATTAACRGVWSIGWK